MIKIFLPIIFIIPFNMLISDNSFRNAQKKYDRVKNAYLQKEEYVKSLFIEKGISFNSFDLYIRAFKKENILQVYAKNKSDKTFKLLNEYNFCTVSGELGPKRMQGDLQIPEGFYHIERFNPVSNYYLSLGINYPNKSDRILGKKNNLGGDIFIHGDCVSIGCIPITDDKIMELYVLCVEAKSNGQTDIPVHIFPFRINESQLYSVGSNFKSGIFEFWKNLKPVYDYFEKNQSLPEITVESSGDYKILGT